MYLFSDGQIIRGEWGGGGEVKTSMHKCVRSGQGSYAGLEVCIFIATCSPFLKNCPRKSNKIVHMNSSESVSLGWSNMAGWE